MIKEVTDMQHFERLARQWNSPENELFWTTQSCSQGRQFYPKRIESNFRGLLHHSIQHEGIMPFIKMWSYEENNISLGGCVFLVDKNMMMQETLLEELLWQCPGRYPHSIKDKKIFSNLNLDIKRGQHTIITGPNGVGKSTLLGLLAGVFYAQSGKILSNTENYGYISAYPMIIRGSLKDNILYGNKNKNRYHQNEA